MLGASKCWWDLRLGTLTTSSSANCKAEDQMPALTKASHQIAPPACQPLTQQLAQQPPKAKRVLSPHWFHEHSTLSPSCWERRAILSPPPGPHWGTQDRSLHCSFQFPVYDSVRGFSVSVLWYPNHASLGDNHNYTLLWAPTQLYHFWKVLKPLLFPHVPKGALVVMVVPAIPSNSLLLRTDPFKPPCHL